MKKPNLSNATLSVALILAWVIHPAAAEQSFFAGKTISLYAGMPAGGGVDDEMRVVARHFMKFIPGNPSIVARNMPGAGAVVLANYLRHQAAADGLTLGMPTRSGFLLSNVVSQSGIKYDLRDFSYIGGAGSNSTTLWLRKPLGITTVDQLKASKREIVIGALAPRTQSALIPRVLAKYEGWPLKIVHGYPGFNEVLIAIERGEIDGLMTAGQISRPDMVSSGFLIPVVQSAPDVANVALLSEVVKNADGRALLDLLLTPSHIGLPLMGPPNIPADRLEMLRQSYRKMTEDGAYRADAERRGIPTDRPVFGPELQAMIAEKLSALPQNVVDEYLAFLK
jgi:tripartite-type tricarboxylate transporter receptor subunit TctC